MNVHNQYMKSLVTKRDKGQSEKFHCKFIQQQRDICIDVLLLLLLLLAYVSQISRPVEASQALVSSSRLTIPSLPDGGRCCEQTSKMWSTVCSGAPHSQTEESLRPQRLIIPHCGTGISHFANKRKQDCICLSIVDLFAWVTQF